MAKLEIFVLKASCETLLLAGVTQWFWPDVSQLYFQGSDELLLLLGFSPRERDSLNSEGNSAVALEETNLFECVVEDDRSVLLDALRNEDSKSFRIESRLRAQDGTLKWFRLVGERVPLTSLGSHQAFAGIALDITDIKRIEIQAREDSKHKSDFLGRMSHDMRTPLHAIMGLVDVLLNSQLDNFQRSLANRVIDASESLLGLVNDLLDIAQIESGRLKIDIKPFDLHRVIWDCCSMHQQSLKYSKVDIKYVIDSQVPRYVLSDSRRILQILNNLVENASKFTKSGNITIHLSMKARRAQMTDVIFQVVDTGIGISPEELELIFKPFYRGSEDDNPRGQGLGLAITREIVQRLGGSIHVQSVLNQGTTFFVELPLQETSREMAELVYQGNKPAAKKVADSLTHEDFSADPKKYKLLIAEDSPVNRQIIKAYLKNPKFSLLFCENGKEALECYKRLKPDLVLMDLRMPVMNGIEATQHIREYEKSSGILRRPIIAVSASALREEVSLSLHSGCDEHFSKPIRKFDLLAAVSKYLNIERLTEGL